MVYQALYGDQAYWVTTGKICSSGKLRGTAELLIVSREKQIRKKKGKRKRRKPPGEKEGKRGEEKKKKDKF